MQQRRKGKSLSIVAAHPHSYSPSSVRKRRIKIETGERDRGWQGDGNGPLGFLILLYGERTRWRRDEEKEGRRTERGKKKKERGLGEIAWRGESCKLENFPRSYYLQRDHRPALWRLPGIPRFLNTPRPLFFAFLRVILAVGVRQEKRADSLQCHIFDFRIRSNCNLRFRISCATI